MRIPTNRQPTHPGEMLREEFLIPMNLTQKDLADAICVPYQRINEIVAGKRGVTPSTALRLAKFFGMSADFWLKFTSEIRFVFGSEERANCFGQNKKTRIYFIVAIGLTDKFSFMNYRLSLADGTVIAIITGFSQNQINHQSCLLLQLKLFGI